MTSQSFEGRILATGGRTTGFDYLRIALAVAVVLWHTFVLSYGKSFDTLVTQGPWRPLIAFILPAFFALSGFLVAGSLERNRSLFRFLSLRALRILPALAVEASFSALVLGPLLTTLSLTAYLRHWQFHHYFLNVIGWIHYSLPGVFASNPFPDIVNAQLWTIPFELECYAALAVLAAVGIARRRWLLLAAILIWTAWFFVTRVVAGGSIMPVGLVSGRLMVAAFLAGAALYRFRDLVPYDPKLFVASALGSAALLSLPGGDFLTPFTLAYCVGFLGLQNPRANWLVKFGDFSYGVYLYGFPVQQVIASAGPWAQHWYINAALALPTATLFAAFSWYVVEKPALGLRSYLSLFDPLDRRIGAIEARAAAGVGVSPLRHLARLPVLGQLLRVS